MPIVNPPGPHNSQPITPDSNSQANKVPRTDNGAASPRSVVAANLSDPLEGTPDVASHLSETVKNPSDFLKGNNVNEKLVTSLLLNEQGFKGAIQTAQFEFVEGSDDKFYFVNDPAKKTFSLKQIKEAVDGLNQDGYSIKVDEQKKTVTQHANYTLKFDKETKQDGDYGQHAELLSFKSVPEKSLKIFVNTLAKASKATSTQYQAGYRLHLNEIRQEESTVLSLSIDASDGYGIKLESKEVQSQLVKDLAEVIGEEILKKVPNSSAEISVKQASDSQALEDIQDFTDKVTQTLTEDGFQIKKPTQPRITGNEQLRP